MRRFTLCAILFCALPAAASGGRIFGYVNPAAAFGNIPVNTETMEWENTGDIPSRNALGIRPVILADLLFFVQDPDIAGPCQPYTMRLREDWRARAANWLQNYAAYLTAEHVAGIAIDSEANSQCLAPEDVQTVARYLITNGVSRDLLGMGEGRSRLAQPFLNWFPPELGWVAVFAYDYLSALDPAYQLILAELKSRLAGNQQYILVPKGFMFFWEVGKVDEQKLGWGTLQCAKYCVGDPQCRGVMVFLAGTVQYSPVDGTGLLGTADMPQKWPWDRMAGELLLGISPDSPRPPGAPPVFKK